MANKIPQNGLVSASDGHLRCFWGSDHDDYREYHDSEWGFPVTDDRRLFEKVCLEGFQSGLSWLTILRKRENFRNAFCNFEFRKVAKFGNKDIERLLQDAGIVRHRGKIDATINNAKRACEMEDEFGNLAAYFWQFEPSVEMRPKKITWPVMKEQLSKTTESTALAKDLKKRGWKFIGPTTAYAFMQAMGLVNDHFEGCVIRDRVEGSRKKFLRPVITG